jgi:hypothetical protein
MKNQLTNIRTKVQFSQYGEVKTLLFVGNKLRALNAVKMAYGIKSVSALIEYKTDNFLIEGITLTVKES